MGEIRAALRPVGHRVERDCDVCGGFDADPRHVFDEVRDGATVPRVAHMDCCAAASCPVCAETEQANKGLRGDALIKHLTKGM